MALMSCPSCNAKVSSRAEICNHCGFPLQGTDSEQTNTELRRHYRNKRRGLQKQQMVAMTLFVIGCVGFFFSVFQLIEQPWLAQLVKYGTPYLLSLSFVWYVINRFRIYFNKVS